MFRKSKLNLFQINISYFKEGMQLCKKNKFDLYKNLKCFVFFQSKLNQVLKNHLFSFKFIKKEFIRMFLLLNFIEMKIVINYQVNF